MTEKRDPVTGIKKNANVFDKKYLSSEELEEYMLSE